MMAQDIKPLMSHETCGIITSDIQPMKGGRRRKILFATSGKIIEYVNLMTGCDERIGYMRADKPGAAGDENFHMRCNN